MQCLFPVAFLCLFLAQGLGEKLGEIWYGSAARFTKPLPYLGPKSVSFPTLLMTKPKI